MVRGRPIGGDLVFGARLLEGLTPFVWRKAVDPGVVDDISTMLARARAEAGDDCQDDLKIGPGGIREVEFFSHALQLAWGGREPRVRRTNTNEALPPLPPCGLVSAPRQPDPSDR